MIKALITGVWACAAALAAVYFTLSMQLGGGHKEENPHAALEAMKPKMISVPVIQNGAVQGYIVAQFVFVVDGPLVKQIPVALDSFLVDESVKAIYGGEIPDFRKIKRQDLAGMTKIIQENINKRFGANIVQDVLIQELSYLPREKARGGASL